MTTEPALLERDAELVELSALLAAARAGRGHVALVSGAAGIGKTALLQRLARDHAPPMRLLWGGCDALFTPRPLAPLQEVAWQHGGELADRLREAAPRDVIFQTFLGELQPPRPPALVVFEDVHWADEATLDLLRFLGRRIARTCALLVISWREDEVSARHALRSVVGDLPRDVVRRVSLAPLSSCAVETLAVAAQRPASGVHAVTGGNPFFVTEILASHAATVPATIRDAVLGRASRLTPRARDMLEVASVMPARAELSLLAVVAGPAFGALDELLEVGMLVLANDAITFGHELARRAIEDAVTPLHARDLHARVLAWLRLQPDDPAQLARMVHHAQRAGDGPAVQELASRAAERADRLGAHREAEAHLTAALQHATSEPHRAALLEARTVQCFLIDRMQDAFESGTAALAAWQRLGERVRQSACLRWLARITWYLTRIDDARRYAEQAVTVLDGLPPGPELAMAWSTRSQLFMNVGASDAAIEWGERALVLARERSYPEVLAHALDNVGCARIQQGDPRGWAELDESLRVARAHGLDAEAARVYANLGMLAVEERRYPEATRWLDEGVAFGDEKDLGTTRVCSLVTRVHLHVVTGQWSAAAEDAELVSADPLASELSRQILLTALGLMRARRGDPSAWEALDASLAIARRANEAERLVPVAAARAELAWLEGDLARARAEVEDTLALAVRLRRAWYIGELAMWSVRGGESPPGDVPIAPPYALQLAGDWRGAAAAFARLGCHYDAALACYEGDDQQALKDALAALVRMDALPAAARIRRRLAELGARGIPRGPRSARREHPFDLTAREQDVLVALALGLSNAEIGSRLFISPKTVDHHVSAILAKLDVPTRSAAVAAARSHGLLDSMRPT